MMRNYLKQGQINSFIIKIAQTYFENEISFNNINTGISLPFEEIQILLKKNDNFIIESEKNQQ